MSPLTLSVVIITLNEEDRIERVIRSLPAAEVLVIDAGSADGTVARARAAGAEVHILDWPGHAAQRNRGLELTQGDVVLFLDADEWLEAPARAEILAVLEGDSSAGWSFPVASTWGGRVLRHGRWYPNRKVRMVRRGRGRWEGGLHEGLVVEGRIRALDADIHHAPYRSLTEHLQTIDRYTRIQAAELQARGVKARRRDPVIHGGWHLFRAWVLHSGWRDGAPGLAVGALGAGCTALKWRRARCS